LLPSSPLRVGVKRRVKCEDVEKTKKGDLLSVHYEGKLYKDGKEFDSSRNRELPLEFMLGAGEVIRGWDLGLVKMCLGEIRKITIPSDLAYGDVGSPHDIYPGATLVYEIELLDISY